MQSEQSITAKLAAVERDNRIYRTKLSADEMFVKQMHVIFGHYFRELPDEQLREFGLRRLRPDELQDGVRAQAQLSGDQADALTGGAA